MHGTGRLQSLSWFLLVLLVISFIFSRRLFLDRFLSHGDRNRLLFADCRQSEVALFHIAERDTKILDD